MVYCMFFGMCCLNCIKLYPISLICIFPSVSYDKINVAEFDPDAGEFAIEYVASRTSSLVFLSDKFVGGPLARPSDIIPPGMNPVLFTAIVSVLSENILTVFL